MEEAATGRVPSRSPLFPFFFFPHPEPPLPPPQGPFPQAQTATLRNYSDFFSPGRGKVLQADILKPPARLFWFTRAAMEVQPAG